MTERMSRVQEILRRTPVVCSLGDLYANALSNGRNDISELRRRGWEIDKFWTSHNEGPAHVHYIPRSAPSSHIKQTALQLQFRGGER